MSFLDELPKLSPTNEQILQPQPTTFDEPFNFPFKPYKIQLDFMRTFYDVCENKVHALLESPTGTGKSLALICSSLTWLKDHQAKQMKELESKKEDLLNKIELLKKEEEESGDWLTVQTRRQQVNRELDDINRELEVLKNFELKSQARWHAKLHDKSYVDYAALNENLHHTQQLSQSNESHAEKLNNSGPENLKCFGESGSQDSNQSRQEAEEDIEQKLKRQEDQLQVTPKVYYASRTHSQLSQFVREITKTKFADSKTKPALKVTALASRANLCVNYNVLKLRDPSAINERCTEMQRETTTEKKCPYLNANQVNILKEDILSSVQDIEDIVSRGRVLGACPYYASRMSIPEAELVVLPYNNLFHLETRKASSLNLKDSIVIVDEAHNILETICSIHSSQISGLQLLSSHTILSRYYQKYHSRMSARNAETIKTIVQCLTAMIKYLHDPRRHLAEYESPKSVTLEELINTPTIATQTCENTSKLVAQEEIMCDVHKFIGASNIERFNVFKIIDYFARSQLARKLIGFFKQDNSVDFDLDLVDCIKNETLQKDSGTEENERGHLQKQQQRKSKSSSELPPPKKRKVLKKQTIASEKQNAERKLEETNLKFLKTSETIKLNNNDAISYPIYVLVEFLKSLTNLVTDGRVCTYYIKNDIKQSMLRFILLNPSSQFNQMVQECRSIVLAGGTMQPFNEFTDLLFGPLGIDEKRLKTFSCGHVIESQQLYVATLSNGSGGKPLELSYKTKTSPDYIEEIGRTILNLSNVVPGGMVCFFPSYEYEQLCFKRWQQMGVLSMIESKSKQVFREPKQASHLKPTLDEYSRVIEKGSSKGRGAMLFCVVGGKMSEGINFNDDLGRCIVMIGLPYANVKSAELQQKMAYYDRTCKKKSQANIKNAIVVEQRLSGGQQYYENLCLKGINQSIGRAVRHRFDYAAIILLDRRYSVKTSIRNGLPKWMCKSLVDHERFGPLLGQMKQFFSNMKAKDK